MQPKPRHQAVRHAPTRAGLTVYRGRTLTPTQYADLYTTLAHRGTVLINSPDQYRHTHYLSESYRVIAAQTPRTVWLPTRDAPDFDLVADLLARFVDAPVLVKDYVKSRKHEWEEACYIPSASDRAAVERIVRRFLELQGPDLNEVLVFREYVPFRLLGTHPKSGMPLSEEYRTFVLDGEPFLTTAYWEGAVYPGEAPPIEQLQAVLRAVDSRFVAADLARTEAGGWVKPLQAAPCVAVLLGTQPAYPKRTNLCNPVEVTVHVHDPHPVVQSRFGNEQVGNWCSVPHPVMMGKVLLEAERPVENVRRRRHDLKASVQIFLERVVVPGRAGRVELFELADRAHEEESGQLGESSTHCGIL